MARDFELVWSARALDELLEDRSVLDRLQELGDEVARVAAERAPKLTGAGAASIRAEVGVDSQGPHVDISWDKDHFYLIFHEVGTEHQPARPFLRPALWQVAGASEETA
jgi:HK97 gp10 family phage protein